AATRRGFCFAPMDRGPKARLTAAGKRVPPAWPPCIRNGALEPPVIPAWKQQRNTGDLRRNVGASLEKPRPSGIAKSWRKWLGPGTGSPTTPTKKALTRRPERILPLRFGAPPSVLELPMACQGKPHLRHEQ